MNKKCVGCGVHLQTENKNKKGYTVSLDKDYCMRCFRWNHYKDFSLGQECIKKEDIISKLNQNSGLTFFFIDFLNLHEEAIRDYEKIKNPKMLVITKLDTIPKSIYLEKIRMWLKDVWQIEKVIFLKKNSNTSQKKIETCISEMRVKTVYFAGITNAGKSTFLNSFFQNAKLTVSEMPNTTLDFLKMKMGDITIYDTPGIPYSQFALDPKFIQKVNLEGEMKPKNYPLKKEASLVIEDKIRISFSIDNNITFFGSNYLQLKKIYEKNLSLLNLNKLELFVKNNSNLYIKGLGFFYIKKASNVNIYGVSQDQISVVSSFLGESEWKYE